MMRDRRATRFRSSAMMGLACSNSPMEEEWTQTRFPAGRARDLPLEVLEQRPPPGDAPPDLPVEATEQPEDGPERRENEPSVEELPEVSAYRNPQER